MIPLAVLLEASLWISMTHRVVDVTARSRENVHIVYVTALHNYMLSAAVCDELSRAVERSTQTVGPGRLFTGI